MKKPNVKKFAPYTKTIMAALAGVLSVLAVVVSVSADGNISGGDWSAIISAVVAAIGGTSAVYQFPNGGGE